MTTFLWVWLITQGIGVGIVWIFTIGLGRRVHLDETPRVAVIVAVKGHDYEFDEFLVRLFEQDYPEFRVIFAVESMADGAVPAVEKCRAIAPDRVALVVAGQRPDEGQKVTNLIAAVATITPEDDVLVFADADIWPEPDWLSRLVAPLVDGTADVVSGFAWLIVKDGRASSYLLAAMAAPLATIPRLPLLNAAWGGSTAITQETFHDLNIAEEWRGTLSDDLHLTQVVLRAGGRIRAPREVLLRTALKTGGFADVRALTLRWFMLARVYLPATFWATLAGMSFTALGWITAIMGTLALRVEVAAVLVAALVLNVLRALGRGQLVKRLWGEGGVAENKQYLRMEPFLAPLAVIQQAIDGWSALLIKRTTWAGITYEVDGPHDVRVLERDKQS